MTLDVQFRIRNNPNFQRYLRDHSYWYKELNRNPASMERFEEEVKDAYKLRPADKVNQILNTLEVLQTLMSSMR